MEVEHFKDLERRSRQENAEDFREILESAQSVADRMASIPAYTQKDISRIVRNEPPFEKTRFFALHDTIRSSVDVPLTHFFNHPSVWRYGGAMRLADAADLTRASMMFMEYVNHEQGEDRGISAAQREEMEAAPDPVPPSHDTWEPMLTAYRQLDPPAVEIASIFWTMCSHLHEQRVFEHMEEDDAYLFAQMCAHSFQAMCAIEYTTGRSKLIEADVGDVLDIEALVNAFQL